MYLYCDLIKARFMEGTWRMVWVSSSKSFCLLVLIWLFFFSLFLGGTCGSDWWWGIKTDLFLLERFGTQSIIFTGLIGVCCFLLLPRSLTLRWWLDYNSAKFAITGGSLCLALWWALNSGTSMYSYGNELLTYNNVHDEFPAILIIKGRGYTSAASRPVILS